MAPDLEKGVVETKYRPGYPSLAAFIASDPDHSIAVYRRFDYLSARNLLYLQSELAELEAQLHTFDQEDLRSSDDDLDNNFARDWKAYRERARDPTSRENKGLDLAIRIREKMKEYRKPSFFIVLATSQLI
jgi:hypothetical protein